MIVKYLIRKVNCYLDEPLFLCDLEEMDFEI